MRITMSMILDCMTDYQFIYGFHSRDKDYSIYNIVTIENTFPKYRSDTIYISKFDFIKDKDRTELPQNIVCIENNLDLENMDNLDTSNFILIKGNYTLLEILDKIQSIISYYLNENNHFMDIIRDNMGLSYLANEIYKFIGNPISIIDTNLKVLAYTDFKLTKDDKWRNLQKHCMHNGYITNGEEQFIYIKDFVHQMNKNNVPIYFDKKEDILEPSICINILVNNKKIGLFGIFETDKKFTIGIYDIMVYLSEILSIELQKNKLSIQYNNDENGYLLYDLLKGKDIPDVKINEIKELLHFIVDDSFTVSVIEQDAISNNYELAFLNTRIDSYTFRSLHIIYKNNIILLSATSDFEIIRKNGSTNNIDNLLKTSKSLMGVSRSFTDLKQINSKYNEACMAIKVGKKVYTDNYIFFYHHVQFYHLIEVCTNQEDNKDLCHPAMFKLLDYDKKKATDFAETLYSYVRNGRSQINTTKELSLHRSSLQYRLNKIEDIMGISLDDYLTMLHIQISMEILKYIT